MSCFGVDESILACSVFFFKENQRFQSCCVRKECRRKQRHHKQQLERKSNFTMRISHGAALWMTAAATLQESGDAFVVPSSSITRKQPQLVTTTTNHDSSRLYTVWKIDDNGVTADNHDEEPLKHDNPPDLRQRRRIKAAGIATALAAGTAVALNAGDLPAAGATTMGNTVPSAPARDAQTFSSFFHFHEPQVSLPYLEEQIRAAEAALQNQQVFEMGGSTVMMADAAVVATPAAPAAPKPAEPAPLATAPKPASPATTAVSSAAADPKPAAPPATPAAPNPATPATVAATAAPAAPATESAALKPAAPAAAKPALAPANKAAPSLYTYTKQHWPEWVKAGKAAYETAEPLVMSISRDVSNQLDTKIIPQVKTVEHRILGDPAANVVDSAFATARDVGKLAFTVVGRAVPVMYEGGKLIVKAVPEVYKAGTQIYNTVDKQIIPEIKKDYRIVKQTVETETPKVIKASKQVYETGRQFAHAVQEDVLPKVMAAEKKLAPKINALEHRILGDGVANVIDKSVDLTWRTGNAAVTVVRKNTPAAIEATKNTAWGVYKTGRFVVKSGTQAYKFVETYVPKAYKTTKDVVIAMDRTGGEIAYVIDAKAPQVTAAIKKEIPKIREMGSQTYKAIDPVARQLAESGKAIGTDIVNLVEKSGNKEEIQALGTVGLATAAVVSAASSDNFLVSTYGPSGNGFSESGGGFSALLGRNGGFTEDSRRRFF
jgi:hypothetical protein